MQREDKSGGLWSEVFTVPPEAVERLFGKESLQAPVEMANLATIYRTAVQNLITDSLRRQRELQMRAADADRRMGQIVSEAMANIAQLEAKIDEIKTQSDWMAIAGIGQLLSHAAGNWDRWFKKKQKPTPAQTPNQPSTQPATKPQQNTGLFNQSITELFERVSGNRPFEQILKTSLFEARNTKGKGKK